MRGSPTGQGELDALPPSRTRELRWVCHALFSDLDLGLLAGQGAALLSSPYEGPGDSQVEFRAIRRDIR